MFVLPVLPEIIKVPLDEWTETDDKGKAHTTSLYPGCVARARPLEAVALAQFIDAFPPMPNGRPTLIAIYTVARERLVGIDGLEMQGDGAPEPFDAKNRLHLQSIGERALFLIYNAVMNRAELQSVDEKNSGSPSASEEMSNGKRSSAGGAKKRRGTTSGVGSRATNDPHTRSGGRRRSNKGSSPVAPGTSQSANAETPTIGATISGGFNVDGVPGLTP